jgi:hypothetical protein
MGVRMRHDGVDEEIEVEAISVKHYERSGWEVVDGGPPVVMDETPALPKTRRRETGEN